MSTFGPANRVLQWLLSRDGKPGDSWEYNHWINERWRQWGKVSGRPAEPRPRPITDHPEFDKWLTDPRLPILHAWEINIEDDLCDDIAREIANESGKSAAERYGAYLNFSHIAVGFRGMRSLKTTKTPNPNSDDLIELLARIASDLEKERRGMIRRIRAARYSYDRKFKHWKLTAESIGGTRDQPAELQRLSDDIEKHQKRMIRRKRVERYNQSLTIKRWKVTTESIDGAIDPPPLTEVLRLANDGETRTFVKQLYEQLTFATATGEFALTTINGAELYSERLVGALLAEWRRDKTALRQFFLKAFRRWRRHDKRRRDKQSAWRLETAVYGIAADLPGHTNGVSATAAALAHDSKEILKLLQNRKRDLMRDDQLADSWEQQKRQTGYIRVILSRARDEQSKRSPFR